jgi:hypothetical protein
MEIIKSVAGNGFILACYPKPQTKKKIKFLIFLNFKLSNKKS